MKDKGSIDTAYSSDPWWYDLRGFFILTFSYRSTLPSQVGLFSRNIRENHLEAAIGSGTLFDLILKWRAFTRAPRARIVGFDYAERMLNGARSRFGKNPQVQLVREDAAALSFEGETFDSANIANSIHTFPEIEPSLREIYRVLRRGGTLAGNCLLYPRGQGLMDRLATSINNWGMKKGILHRPYYADEIRHILRSTGFRISWERIKGNSYDFVAEKPEL